MMFLLMLRILLLRIEPTYLLRMCFRYSTMKHPIFNSDTMKERFQSMKIGFYALEQLCAVLYENICGFSSQMFAISYSALFLIPIRTP